MKMPDYKKSPPPQKKKSLSSLQALFSCHAVLRLCRGEERALLAGGGEVTQLLLLTGQSSMKRATQKKPSHKHFPSVWELVTATLELRRFHVSFWSFFFFFLPPQISPRGCCTAGAELYSEVFQKEEKVVFFSDVQKGTAWLIVKWRDR